MLLNLLSQTDKKHLFELLELLSLADNPLLWDGKRKEDITSETNLDKLSIQKEEREDALIAQLDPEGKHSAERGASSYMTLGPFGIGFVHHSIEARLVKELKAFPLQIVEEPATRIQAATRVLKDIIKGKTFELPSVPKLMLFELLSMALCDGTISSIEWSLLKEFQQQHQLEDFIFDDILERAEAMNREVSKTISLILE